jgi:tetratricopeptide (TPR) repeat protein
MDIDEYRTRVGVFVGLAVAAATASYMWHAGELDLSAGRPVLLLVLIAAGPPVIAGTVAGLAAAFWLGSALYHAAQARRLRRADEGGEVGGTKQRKKPPASKQPDSSASRKSRASAARQSHPPAARQADHDAQDTPLHLAARKGQTATIEALVEKADKWPPRNGAGKTFLEVAPAKHAQAVRSAFNRAYGKAFVRGLGWELHELGPDAATRDLFETWAERYVARFDDTTDFNSLDWMPGSALAAEILLEIGAANSDARNLDVALAAENAAVRLDPANPFAFVRRCITWARIGDLDRSLADAAEAVRLAPASALAYQMRGAAHDDLGDEEEAIADYSKALELDPQASCQPRLNELIASWLRR